MTDKKTPRWYWIFDHCGCDQKCKLIDCHRLAFRCTHREKSD